MKPMYLFSSFLTRGLIRAILICSAAIRFASAVARLLWPAWVALASEATIFVTMAAGPSSTRSA
jgi:hypothetical protein